MDIIRLAIPEEVAAIQATSDITPTSTVLTFGGKDFAVMRNCFELDPVIFSEGCSNQRKLLFIMNIETSMRLQGIKEYYFNVAADNDAWRQVVETSGASPVSVAPEIRYKKAL